MHLFLGWRALDDRLIKIAHRIELVLWGDGRARHTFLIACTDEHPLLLIEIDGRDGNRRFRRTMKLNIRDLEEVPNTILKIELIGETSSPTALEDLIRAAEDYVEKHPRYKIITNNCRTFVEHCIDQVPEFRDSIPRKRGSILEYYHARAKHENPGAILRSTKFLKDIQEQYRSKRQYTCIQKLILNVELPKEENDNGPEIYEILL